MNIRLQLVVSLVMLLSSLLTAQDKAAVLIVDGFSNHDWKQTTKVVKTILERSGLFEVAVSTVPADTTLSETWNPQFHLYDVVIQNTNNINNKSMRWPARVEQSLEAFVLKGGGLYILHSANNAFEHWDAYNVMIGLGWRSADFGKALQIDEEKGIVEIPSGQGKSTYHGPRHDQVIKILSEHPINEGFPSAWKTPDVELYKFARGPAKDLTVLSYSIEQETGLSWPVEWVVKYGEGDVYTSSMGHLWKGMIYPVGYRCVGFQTTLIRAVEWLATGKTTYPIPENFPSSATVSLVSDDLEE
ncbi:MAG: ThuA domain-containing protein [Cyclobacteriaceae bacterium]